MSLPSFVVGTQALPSTVRTTPGLVAVGVVSTVLYVPAAIGAPVGAVMASEAVWAGLADERLTVNPVASVAGAGDGVGAQVDRVGRLDAVVGVLLAEEAEGGAGDAARATEAVVPKSPAMMEAPMRRRVRLA